MPTIKEPSDAKSVAWIGRDSRYLKSHEGSGTENFAIFNEKNNNKKLQFQERNPVPSFERGTSYRPY